MFHRFFCPLLILAAATTAVAQVGRDDSTTNERSSRSKTVVSVQLIADKQADGLTAQQWGKTFADLGYSVQIRQPILEEKIEVKERTLGSLREVTVIGKLDRSGKLIFADRTFTRSQAGKLAEWLRSLEVYGAQGSPDGKPVWGLSQTQFDILFNAMSKQAEGELAGKPLEETVQELKLPANYPVRYTAAARELLAVPTASRQTVRTDVAGHSKGTALALVLSEYGLGFRPQRRPDGGLELAIETKEKVPDVWPIGWELKETRAKTAPQLFKLVPVELEKVKLVDALNGIATVTEVPIHLDRTGIAAQEIDVDEIFVSYPAKKTSWSLLLRSITTPHRLTRKFRVDEAGRPFVWVTALVPTRNP